jgi:hypothetical protein
LFTLMRVHDAACGHRHLRQRRGKSKDH